MIEAKVTGIVELSVTFAGQRNVRYVKIFWVETVERTIVFE